MRQVVVVVVVVVGTAVLLDDAAVVLQPSNLWISMVMMALASNRVNSIMGCAMP